MPALPCGQHKNAWSPGFWAGFAACGTILVLAVPLLNLWVPSDSSAVLPDYLVPLLGKYLCYALLALSQVGNVSPNLGTIYIVDSFLVVVFGGVGNLMGTLVGALSLGVVNKFLEPAAGAILGKIVVLVAIILFIQRRPRGLFALKGRTAEAEA